MTGWGRTGGSLSLAAVAACGLCACQTGGGSPAGKPIAFESIEGAPAAVRTALAGELASAASARQVEIVGNGNPARYRLRGYLTAEPTADGGTALAFVWDVFDTDQRRARRVTGSAPIKAASRKNPWDGLDKEALARLAARSMDEIATFLAAGPRRRRRRPRPRTDKAAALADRGKGRPVHLSPLAGRGRLGKAERGEGPGAHSPGPLTPTLSPQAMQPPRLFSV